MKEDVSEPRKLNTKDNSKDSKKSLNSKDSKKSLTVNFDHLVLGLNFRGENWDQERNRLVRSPSESLVKLGGWMTKKEGKCTEGLPSTQ